MEAEKIVKRIEMSEHSLVSKLEKRREEIADRHVESFVKKQRQEM